MLNQLKLVPKIAWASLAAILLLGGVAALVGVIPTYAEICEISEREHEHCAYYNIALFSFIKITKFLDDHGGALTAIATIAIAWFMLSLRDATSEQGRLTQQSIDLTKQSIDLAHAEFIATHRPQFRISFCRILPFDSDRSHDAQPLKAKFTIINIGTSEGTITGSAVQLVYLYETDRPYLPDLPRNDIVEPDIRLYSGMTITLTATGDQLSGSMHPGILGRVGKILYLVGWITYRDGRDNPRTTYFCRQYMPDLKRFIPVDDPECEQTC